MGIEPTTFCLRSKCSTTKLLERLLPETDNLAIEMKVVTEIDIIEEKVRRMCFLFQLVDGIILTILGEWCVAKDISRLDRAFCNRVLREQLFQLLSSAATALCNVEFKFRKYMASEHKYTKIYLRKFYEWYTKRKLHINKLWIHAINTDFAEILQLQTMKNLLSIHLSGSVRIDVSLLDTISNAPQLLSLTFCSSSIVLSASDSLTHPVSCKLQSLTLCEITFDEYMEQYDQICMELIQLLPTLRVLTIQKVGRLTAADVLTLIQHQAHQLQTFTYESHMFTMESRLSSLTFPSNRCKLTNTLEQLTVTVLPQATQPALVAFLQRCSEIFPPIVLQHFLLDRMYDEWNEERKRSAWAKYQHPIPTRNACIGGIIPLPPAAVDKVNATITILTDAQTRLDPSLLVAVIPYPFTALTSLYLTGNSCHTAAYAVTAWILATGCLQRLTALELHDATHKDPLHGLPFLHTIARGIHGLRNNRLQRLALCGGHSIVDYDLVNCYLTAFPNVTTFSLHVYHINHIKQVLHRLLHFNAEELRALHITQCIAHAHTTITLPVTRRTQRQLPFYLPQLRVLNVECVQWSYEATCAVLQGAPLLWAFTNNLPDMTQDCTREEIQRLKTLFTIRNIAFNNISQHDMYSFHHAERLVWNQLPAQ